MLNLQPITLLPARERVAASLRKAIISKKLEQGEVLTLEATSKALGVSATPVREAFQILARDNLIELRQNKTAVVLGVSRQTIREHYQVRAALESVACVLACQNKADFAAVENCCAAAEKVLAEGDNEAYADLNQSFHYEIWKASGNEKMQGMLSELWNVLSMGIETTLAEYADKSHGEHKEILDALKKWDADRAGNLMYRHIIRSMGDMLSIYK